MIGWAGEGRGDRSSERGGEMVVRARVWIAVWEWTSGRDDRPRIEAASATGCHRLALA